MMVTIAESGRRKGSAGRYHLDPECRMITAPKRARLVSEEFALSMGRWQCPYCAPLPPCCATDTHHAATLVPQVPLAPAEMPEWERELLADADALREDDDDALRV